MLSKCCSSEAHDCFDAAVALFPKEMRADPVTIATFKRHFNVSAHICAISVFSRVVVLPDFDRFVM